MELGRAWTHSAPPHTASPCCARTPHGAGCEDPRQVPPAVTHAAPEPIFALRGIYMGFSEPLLEDASHEVYPGETLAILGESGCGKSIWLKMMIGLIEPLQGKVLFKGQDVGKMSPAERLALRRSVGYLFQGSALFDSMTVLDNVSYALREHTDASEDSMRERVVQCLEWVGLEERILELHPAALSGGMRKRVALARAIAVQPEMVLYDEPTQGLDPQSITRIADLIVDLKKRLSITSILVTHDMRSAFGVCDRIALLHDKKFAYVGTPEQFVASREPPVRDFIKEALTEIWTVRPDLKQYLPA